MPAIHEKSLTPTSPSQSKRRGGTGGGGCGGGGGSMIGGGGSMIGGGGSTIGGGGGSGAPASAGIGSPAKAGAPLGDSTGVSSRRIELRSALISRRRVLTSCDAAFARTIATIATDSATRKRKNVME